MLDAAEANGKQLIVAFQWRFDEKTQFLKRQIDAGVFGDIMYVRVQALRRRGIPSWGVFGQKKLSGGGPMIDLGVHCIEMAHYLMGTPKPMTATGNIWTYLGNAAPQTNAEWGPWDHKTYDVEDLAAGLVRFENGSLMTVEASFAAHIKKNVWNVEIMGTKGGGNWELSEVYTDAHGDMLDMRPSFLPKVDNFVAKMKALRRGLPRRPGERVQRRRRPGRAADPRRDLHQRRGKARGPDRRDHGGVTRHSGKRHGRPAHATVLRRQPFSQQDGGNAPLPHVWVSSAAAAPYSRS